MSETTRAYAFRLSANLVEKVDAYAAARARIDGRPCDRSTALRLLLEKGLMYQVPTNLETPATSEVIRGNITDPPFEPAASPPPKKKQPHRKSSRLPGLAFMEAFKRTESPKKKR